jgi:hypothetical protein
MISPWRRRWKGIGLGSVIGPRLAPFSGLLPPMSLVGHLATTRSCPRQGRVHDQDTVA